MTTRKQSLAAKLNIKKAQKAWHSMSSRQRSMAQPQGRGRVKPGAGGEGKFFRIVVRPKEEFVSFRMHDVGKKGHVERLSGRRQSGSWNTQAWLISKKDAHIEDHHLVADSAAARNVMDMLGSAPKWVKADIFKARDRINIPEEDKPTTAQKKTRMENIHKAQAARW